MYFHDVALSISNEGIKAKEEEEAKIFDLWAAVAVRYGLQVTGLRCEFYRLAGRDNAYEKLVIPTLEQSTSVAFAENLAEPIEKLDSHFTMQLMKQVATLRARNATKRAGGRSKGDATGKK